MSVFVGGRQTADMRFYIVHCISGLDCQAPMSCLHVRNNWVQNVGPPPKANKINLFQWRWSFSVLRNHSINYSSPPSNIGLEISTQNIAKKHGQLPVYAVWPPQPPNVCRYSLAGVLVWYQYTNADIDTASADVWDRNPHYVINTSVLAFSNTA